MDIHIEDLTKVYHGGVRALDQVSLTIPSGMFGLLGPTVRGRRRSCAYWQAFCTRVAVASSSADARSGAIVTGPKSKRWLGYLPQDLGMYPDLSAREFS